MIDHSTRLLDQLSPLETTCHTFVELSREELIEVWNHLIAAEDALVFGHSRTKEIRSRLETENGRIICQLLDKTFRKPSERSDEKTNNQNDGKPPLKKQKG